MAETAAHLIDCVIPRVPVCQWVRSFAIPLRILFAAHPDLLSPLLQITQPAIANERLKRNRAGQVVLQLKSPYQDATTHIVTPPLEFMQRVGALVPHPRLHLIRSHGVLAPNAKLRAAIVPSPPENTTEHAADHAHAHCSAPARMSWARLLKRVFDIDSEHGPRLAGAP